MIRQESIQIPFRYAAGEMSGRFLREQRETGRFLATVCASCGYVACPPRASCPRCFEATETVREVGPGGTLVSWTERPGRGVFGLVRLDGADGALVLVLPCDESWRVGQRVQPSEVSPSEG